MAFSKANHKYISSPTSDYALGLNSYVTSDDNKATVAGANYFVGIRLRVGDLILCSCSNGSQLLQVATVTSDAQDIVSASTTVAFAIAS